VSQGEHAYQAIIAESLLFLRLFGPDGSDYAELQSAAHAACSVHENDDVDPVSVFAERRRYEDELEGDAACGRYVRERRRVGNWIMSNCAPLSRGNLNHNAEIR
jgi:hypothetical protein